MAEEIRKGFKDKAGNKVSLSAKVEDGTAGNFAGIDADENVVDSGKKPTDFAAAEHTHHGISNAVGGSVSVNDFGNVRIEPKSGGGAAFIFGSNVTEVTSENVANLKRALRAPDNTPTEDSDNLLTSGSIYTALAGIYDFVTNAEARINRLELACASSLPDSDWETIEDLSFDGNQTGYKYTFGGTADSHDYVPNVGDIVRIKGASHTYSYYGVVTGVDTAPYAIETDIDLSQIQSSSAYLQILTTSESSGSES